MIARMTCQSILTVGLYSYALLRFSYNVLDTNTSKWKCHVELHVSCGGCSVVSSFPRYSKNLQK